MTTQLRLDRVLPVLNDNEYCGMEVTCTDDKGDEFKVRVPPIFVSAMEQVQRIYMVKTSFNEYVRRTSEIDKLSQDIMTEKL